MHNVPQQAPMPVQPGKSNVALIVIVVVAGVIAVGVAAVGVVAALGIYGTRRYLVNAKESEGKSTVGAIARAAIAAADRESMPSDLLSASSAPLHELPPTSSPVPSSVPAGRKYMSSPSDWSDPGWKALKFQMSEPQYFQYQWELKSKTEGVVIAKADFDGDGRPDVTFRLPVRCTSEMQCSAAPSIAEIR